MRALATLCLLASSLAVDSAHAQTQACGSATMYYRNSANWNASAAMACLDNKFQTSVFVAGAGTSFKFDRFANWSESYGDNVLADASVNAGGANIPFSAGAGYYGIELNYPNRTYKVAKCAGNRLSQTPSNGTPGQMKALECDAKARWYSIIQVAAGQTWQVTNANLPEQFVRYGDSNNDGVLEAYGTPLAFAQPGKYKLVVNPSTLAYSVTPLDCGLSYAYERASLTGKPQTTSMSCDLDTLSWTGQIAPWSPTSGMLNFWFRDYAAAAWGDQASNGFSGTLRRNESFNLSTSGEILLSVTSGDSKYRFVSVQAFASTYATMTLRGSGTAWNPKPMKLVGDHTWQTKVVFDGYDNSRFKFDVAGNWATNFGDDNRDGIAGQNQTDILISSAGTYTIDFNDATKRYTITRTGN